jgi:glycosyltransferase involved in cell wall biosynthesis
MISVALCTHNGERFIVEQLESILSQTLVPDEIVLSDDASTDRTVELARQTVQRAADAPTLTVLTNARPLGVTGNFERAIDACMGDIIVLSDQDDRWRPDRVERAMASFAERDDLLLLHGDAELVDDTGTSLNVTLFDALGVSAADFRDIHTGKAFDVLMRRNLVTGATVAFRSRLASIAAPFPPAWVHDEWLAIVASATGVLDVLESPLIDYRQHGANQIGVAKLGLGGKLRRMREPGADRNARLLERATQLVNRFGAMGVDISPERLALATGKLRHEAARSALPRTRLLRLPGVLRELGTGRYAQFGRGTADAVRDLIQPHAASR